MKFNLILSTLFIFNISLLSQTTFFIKYKSTVPLISVEQKIIEKKISNTLENRPVSMPEFSVNYFAGGLAKNDEVLGRIITIHFAEKVDNNYLSNLLNQDPEIEYTQVSNTYQIDAIPNDSLVSQQWSLQKIKAFDAWDITTGSDTVLLAVIDTGIDYKHPDLKNKIYLNTGELGNDINDNDKRFNGIDDDENGFVDDYMGWDFTDRVGFPFDSTGGDYLNWDNDPNDDQGHGTFIAGITAAETNNITGIAGTAPKIKILNLRAFDPGGYGEEDDVAAAILYAVQMKAKVINMSFGDNSFSLVLRDVIRYAYSQNVVLVASAGNSGSNLPHYPSGYAEVICVGNSTIDDAVAPSSNWGSTIDLVAPGTNVITTSRNSGYSSINGTSASAPFVSATAALILSQQNFSNDEVKQILKSTSDDIGETGWDLRSGAGRLNVERALRVLAPSIVKFNHPTMDFATSGNNLLIDATILSAYFQSFKLQLGTGYIPTNWQSLIEDGKNQFNHQNIYNLDLSNLQDTVYTLRLLVFQNNGRTLEERVNFYIDRTAPQTELVSLGPMYYGDKLTIMSAVYTGEPSLVRLYYKKQGESSYNFITLDGFTTNNQFVKQLHYGFIPKDLIEQNSVYNIFLEAENLVGLKTIIKYNGADFNISTENLTRLVEVKKMPFSLPAGSPYQSVINLTTESNGEVVVRTNSNSRNSTIFSFTNGEFALKDSISDRFVKDHGDFNRNGLSDLLTFFVRDGFMMEQNSQNSTKFSTKFSKTGGDFWPILAKDIDNDNKTEVLVIKNDSTIGVWESDQSLNLTEKTTIKNFTQKKFGNNVLDFPNAVICDSNGDGLLELWFVDNDGDIFSFRITGDNNFSPDVVIPTEFIGSNAYLTAGDFNFDGIDDIAVLLHSIEPLDIAPFYRLIIFTLAANNFNVIYDFPFIDPTTEFNNSFRRAENSLRFVDIDSDGVRELILFTFPYAYIFKYSAEGTKLIAYFENINSNSILVSDFNNNFIPEIAFPNSSSIDFYEFGNSFKTPTPFNFDAYSISANSVKLSWLSEAERYLIYRGDSADSLILIDSVTINSFWDYNVLSGRDYYYAVQAFDGTKPDPYSAITNAVKVFVHNPAQMTEVNVKSSRNLMVKFNERIKTTIENLQSFEIINFGYPTSISPADQYSYLLSFKSDIPQGTHNLVVKNLRDFYNSPIITDTLNFTVHYEILQGEFYITNSQIIGPYQISLSFNLPVDEISASDKNNYIFSPANQLNTITVIDKTVLLDLTGNKPVGSVGKEYVLRLNNIKSSSSSGYIPIKSGAGSYIVLTGNAADLSDVYVYPNPVKFGEGNSRLTFANLTRRVKINILSLRGNQIKEIIANTDNGGVEYDLTDDKGDKLPSGVYLYRIVSLDDTQNETQEIFGKFAVIR
ncbi:S8 family serine peptidase [Ignavibacterium sp.]|uniref:S8 family serine peptidase n=1 Tax=Ignavibacterium sp. TaxID=2651167 RepID=UPI00307EFC9E